jgi:hypothetical protein
MARGRLRRECRARLAGFTVPTPFSLDALCAQVSRSRGRPLHLHPLDLPAGPGVPCGMWVATERADHVFHARGASALHQQNIVLHEIGHMICDHRIDNGGAALAAVLTDLDPAMVVRVLMRTRYSTPEEEEAEMIAALILEQAGWASSGPRPDGLLGLLDDVFGVSRSG